MDVRLSDEQVALRDSVARVVDRLRPRTVRDLEDTERRAKLEAALEASGWRELRTSAGSGPLASAVEVAVVAEELARGLADAAFVGPTLAVELRRCTGASPARSLETVVLTPELSTLAESGNGGTVSGVAVDAAGCASALVLGVGRTPASITLGPAVSGVDLTRPSAARMGDGPETIGARRLDEPGLLRWTALGLSIGCADLVGVMRGALDLATDYANARRQFGVPVGSFQAVQHLLADALVSLEGSRSVARHAAWAVDALPPGDAVTATSLAKAYCSRAARAVCETAVQVHGGIGQTWECVAHLYLRRSVLSADLLGGVGPSLDRVVAAALGGAGGLR